MKILNFGSLNIDHVYQVDTLVEEGSTIKAGTYERYCGGKGLNQSVAIALAGAKVCHAGAVGADGDLLITYLKAHNVDTSLVSTVCQATGHAMIQVDRHGKNGIVVFGGANQTISEAQIDAVLSRFSAGDYITLQNEISNVALILKKAHEKGMVVFFNPSPLPSDIQEFPFNCVDYLFLNETEGAALSGESSAEKIVSALLRQNPHCSVILTLGNKGVYFASREETHSHGIYQVPVVDTTAAGDTFSGFFIASISAGKTVSEALETASRASSICISRPGASSSIPSMEEVIKSKLEPV